MGLESRVGAQCAVALDALHGLETGLSLVQGLDLGRDPGRLALILSGH